MSSGNAYLDGSPLDRNVFLVLMVLGLCVIMRRSVRWGSVATENVALSLFFLFTFASIFWSDFPFVAFKRWYKVIGNVIMALVVLTDDEPQRAFTALMRRCGYLLVPLSVLYLKYYPELSRGFDAYTGAATNWGITTNKNDLGNLCFIMGIFFLAMMFAGRKETRFMTGLDWYIGILFLVMCGWLQYRAESSTALVSTVIGVSVILGLRSGTIRRHFSVLLVVACLVVGSLLAFTNIKDAFILALGEDTTLTGRTDLWADLLTVPINTMIGAGFESFWLGDRLEFFWGKYWWRPNQAHDGYLEMYLNLGLVGLLLLCLLLLSGLRKARKQTLIDSTIDSATALARGLGEFRLAFLLGLAAYNITDATFKAVHPSFFMFFLVSLECGAARVASVPRRSLQITHHARGRFAFGRATPKMS